MSNEIFTNPNSIPVFAFAGFSNSGKTTLVCKVIASLKDQGIRIASVKHDGHDFSMDQQGKDTWKHQQAGAEVVAITSANKLAILDYRSYERTEQLKQVLQYIRDVDLIIVEGFKTIPIPKIFIVRDESQLKYLEELPAIEGIATDLSKDFFVEQYSLPVYDINDVQTICDYIVNRFSLHGRSFAK